ncbi:MAG: MFS transporter [Rhodothermia bacterium]|nr:MAG: MFS transporter [Rhodothermia bacterium]
MSNRSKSASLSVMMFLQFFVWGAWYVTVGNFMVEKGMGDITHWAYTVGPLAAIISPFFLGMVSDRYFDVEKVLGVLHLLSGGALLLTPMFSNSPTTFILVLGVHMLFYTPTLGLVNSLAFHNITNQEKQFPLIRVFGTIGWIVAGVLVSTVLGADQTAVPFYVAGTTGIVLGLFSFTLPHTPPPAASQKSASFREIMGIDALSRLSSRSFNVFLISSFLISIPLAAYYNFAPIFVNDAGLADPATKMSFGQMSEVLFLLAMPFFFRRLGVKWMLLVGMGAWVLRYVLFALAAPAAVVWMILFGILLHGICYDFFFVTGQIYVDKKSSPEIRSQAQGFLVLLTYGAGMFIGAQLSGWLYNFYKAGSEIMSWEQWQSFWWAPAIFAGVIMLIFAVLFNDEVEPDETT